MVKSESLEDVLLGISPIYYLDTGIIMAGCTFAKGCLKRLVVFLYIYLGQFCIVLCYEMKCPVEKYT